VTRDTAPAMRSTSYELRVLEIDEGIGRSSLSALSPNEIRVKLLLVPEDDINCTSNVTLVEGQNFWWVRQKTFESAWFSHLDKTAAAAEVAAAEAATAATAAAATAAAAAVSSEAEIRAATLAKLFVKTKGERDGNPGNFYKCSVPGCFKKDHYFVKKGELKKVYNMCKIEH